MLEKEKLRQKYSDKIAVEKERNIFETQKRLKEQEIEFKVRLWDMYLFYCPDYDFFHFTSWYRHSSLFRIYILILSFPRFASVLASFGIYCGICISCHLP
jgi:hypothetical protein